MELNHRALNRMALNKRRIRLALLMVSASLAAFSQIASAEKADRDKAFLFASDRQEILQQDKELKSWLLTGNVIICQGTILMKTEKLVLKEDKNGARFGEGAGSPVFFTQKQEGRADYLEATGGRLEFDERTNSVKFFTNSKLKLGADNLSADYIYYNTVTERYEASGTAPGAKVPGGRVQGVLYPKQKDGVVPETVRPPTVARSTCPLGEVPGAANAEAKDAAKPGASAEVKVKP